MMIGGLILAASAPQASVTVDGTALSVSVSGAAGPRVVELRIRDAVDQGPVRDADPLAWLTPWDPAVSCSGTIARAEKDALGSPAVTLNGLRIVAAFADGSIALLDPQKSFVGTQLEGALDLGAPVAGIVIDPEAARLVVIRADGRLMAIEAAASPRVTASRMSAAGTALAWLDRQPWTADAEALTAFDASTLAVTARYPAAVGASPMLRSAPGGGLVLGGLSGPVFRMMPGSARLVPIGAMEGLRDAAFLSKASEWIVATGEGTLVIVGDELSPVRGVAGVRAIGADRGGRFALAIADDGHSLALIDGSDGRVLDTRPLEDAADRLTLSRDFAYVHSAKSKTVQLVSFEVLRQQQRISTVDLPFGEEAANGATPFQRVAIMPGGAAVIGNDGKTLYAYAEGMMVPMGTFAGVTRTLAGVAVIDRSLRETSPGVYRTTAALPYGGRFRMSVRLGNPRVDACMPIDLPGPAMALPTRRMAAHFAEARLSSALGAQLDVRLFAKSGQHRVLGLATDTLGRWQRHFPLESVGVGTFFGRVSFPAPGPYRLIALDARADVTVAAGAEARP